jgi:hypothetical protein
MFSRIREHFRRQALARVKDTIQQLAFAICAANAMNDHAAARYFEAELEMARARRADLLGVANPGRYCCDQRCERQGREACARELLPPLPRTVRDQPTSFVRRHWRRAALLVAALVWGGTFFFLLT